MVPPERARLHYERGDPYALGCPRTDLRIVKLRRLLDRRPGTVGNVGLLNDLRPRELGRRIRRFVVADWLDEATRTAEANRPAEADRALEADHRALEAGKRLRRILEPVARELGVDYDRSYQTPPSSDVEVAMSAMRSGTRLLDPFVSMNIWPVDEFGRGISKPDAEKAEAYLDGVLRRKQGRDAISMMAQGYGRTVAAQWRRAAEMDEYRDASDRLRENATASEHLADLVASIWPVRGYKAALEQVARADAHRLFDVDNPHARADLRDYALKTRAVADALAVAMSARFDEFAHAILGPIYELHVRYHADLLSMWAGEGKSWSNLLRADPVSQREVDQAYMERVFGDSDLSQA